MGFMYAQERNPTSSFDLAVGYQALSMLNQRKTYLIGLKTSPDQDVTIDWLAITQF
jgi:hypothetical protein